MLVPPYLNSSSSTLWRSWNTTSGKWVSTMHASTTTCVCTCQRSDKVAVVVAHHTNLLSLFENIVDAGSGAVQHDVWLCRVLYLLEKWPAKQKSDYLRSLTLFWTWNILVINHTNITIIIGFLLAIIRVTNLNTTKFNLI